jgi:abortive infection bacteriophage resistance protein
LYVTRPATPLNDAHHGGFFIMGNQKKYSKSFKTSSGLISLLESRGLIINDKEFAEHILKTIGYYRLSGYFKPFYQNNHNEHIFNPNIKFEAIWHTYVFDRKLRIHTLDAIERLEVVLRASISNILTEKYGINWYLRSEPFKASWVNASRNSTQSQADRLKKEVNMICQNRKEEYIKHFYSKYDNPKYPPGWMMVEAFSFGICTNIYDYLKSDYQHQVAKIFGDYHPQIIKSVFNHIRYVRNICAHHGRLWNKTLVIRPKAIKKFSILNEDNVKKYYGSSYILFELLKEISPGSTWKDKLYQLISGYQDLPLDYMGFQEEWTKDNYWE